MRAALFVSFIMFYALALTLIGGVPAMTHPRHRAPVEVPDLGADHKIRLALTGLQLLREEAKADGRKADAEALAEVHRVLKQTRFVEIYNFDRWQAAEAVIDGLNIEQWTPEDGDARCQQCGRPNPPWLADDDLWNSVMGGEAGVLCPTCFTLVARDAGAGAALWRLEDEDQRTRDFQDEFDRGYEAGIDHAEAE